MEIPDGKIAMICEGQTEITLMNLLLEGDKFRFPIEQLLEERILNKGYYRDPKLFASNFLGMNYEYGLNVFLVHDKGRNYNIPRPFDQKVDGIYQFITNPEIEKLLIYHLGLEKDYDKRGLKPSLYLANYLKKKSSEIKGAQFLLATFSADSLVDAIKIYDEKNNRLNENKNEFRLNDLVN